MQRRNSDVTHNKRLMRLLLQQKLLTKSTDSVRQAHVYTTMLPISW